VILWCDSINGHRPGSHEAAAAAAAAAADAIRFTAAHSHYGHLARTVRACGAAMYVARRASW